MQKIVVGIGLAVMVFLLAWLWCGRTPAITNYPPPNSIIVAFGDSLIDGVGATNGNDVVSQLSRRLGRPIVNMGVSGNTTAQGVSRMGEVIEKRPGTVILLLGGNDTLRRLSVEESRTNLTTLITSFHQAGAVVVLVGVRGGVLRDGRAEMYETLAKQYGTVYVPDVLAGILLKPELMSDGIHPNDAGYAIIAERLHKVFQKYEL